MLKNLRKDNKKGFTLVEVIVVLVIIAILAAFLVPTLSGYIDSANEKKVVANARQAVIAAQTLAQEEYAKGPTGTITLNADKIKALAEVTGTITASTVDTKGKVIALTYTEGSTTIAYDGTEYKKK